MSLLPRAVRLPRSKVDDASPVCALVGCSKSRQPSCKRAPRTGHARLVCAAACSAAVQVAVVAARLGRMRIVPCGPCGPHSAHTCSTLSGQIGIRTLRMFGVAQQFQHLFCGRKARRLNSAQATAHKYLIVIRFNRCVNSYKLEIRKRCPIPPLHGRRRRPPTTWSRPNA